MRSFAIRIGVDTPVVLDNLMHLDGVLCAMRVAEGAAWDDIPIDQTDGIWHASAALLECGPFGPAHGQVVRLKHIRIGSVPPAIAEAMPPSQKRIGEMSTERNKLTPHNVFAGVRAVWFAARGDLGGTMRILSRLKNLGSMGRTGYGRVTELEAVDYEKASLCGLAYDGAQPARTMPLALWKHIGGADAHTGVVSEERPKPPYWHGPKVICISPIQADLIGTRNDIQKLLTRHTNT